MRNGGDSQLAIKVNREQLDVVKQNMMEANQRSHFIIFESVENQTSEALRLITDYDSFQTIKEQHHDEASMAIAQDIVPVPTHLQNGHWLRMQRLIIRLIRVF